MLPFYLLGNQWTSDMQQLQRMMQKSPPEITQELKNRNSLLFTKRIQCKHTVMEQQIWTNLADIQAKCFKLLSILLPRLC